jgi:hypothetical protein
VRAFLVKLPSLVRYWTVVDDGYRVVRVADEYPQHLRLGQVRRRDNPNGAWAKSRRLPLAEFLTHPRARPLPGFGPCRVVACIRQAHARRGLCRAHDVRWWEQHRTGTAAVADFDGWRRSSAPVASGHEVVLRGLAPLVQAEILFGLQERCRYGALTYLYQLRIFCRRLPALVCGWLSLLPVPDSWGTSARRLTLAGATMETRREVDVLMSRENLRPRVTDYTAGQDAALGLISPVFADLSGLPPLIIQAGTHEVLLDDAVRLARQAATADVEVTLDITPRVPHVFQAYYPILDEAPPHWTEPDSS